MFNENFLRLLESKNDNDEAHYVTLITKTEPNSECNQESLKITILQVNNTTINDIIENKNYSQKEFTIFSNLTINDNNVYSSTLLGYYTDKKNKTEIQKGSSLLGNYIEVIDCKLNKEIDIDFEREYINKPNILINIDENYKSLYTEDFFSYKQNNNEKYTGVTISFKNLKTKSSYPIINIIIIGDKKTEE